LASQSDVDNGRSSKLVVDTEHIVVVGDGAGESNADILDMVGAHVGGGRRSRRSGDSLGR